MYYTSRLRLRGAVCIAPESGSNGCGIRKFFQGQMNLPVNPPDLRLAWHGTPWIVLAVAAFVFLAPNVDLATALQWHDGQRLGQLLLLGVVLLLLGAPHNLRATANVWICLRPWARWAWLMALALGLVSSVLAALPRWALLEWGLLCLLLMGVFAVAAQRRTCGEKLDGWLVLLFYAAATAYAVSSAVVYMTMLLAGPAYGQAFNVLELYHGFSNVRFFGYLQTMLLPFLLLPAMWWGTTLTRRILLWSVPIAWWMLVIGSGSRGTWVALLVGMIAVLLFAGRPGRYWVRWQLAALVGGGVCYGLFVLLLPQWLAQPAVYLHRSGEIMSLSLREILWTEALQFSWQQPWLGIGPMHYAHVAARVAAHPHNAVLQWLAEWGIPAALLMTTLCATAGLVFAGHVRRVVQAGTANRVLVQVPLLAALAGAAAQSMVDGILVMPVSQTLLVLLCGWAMGLYFEERRCTAQGSVSVRWVMAAVTLAAAILVAWGVAPEIGHIAEREQAYLTAHPPENPALPNLMPRFWTQGRIE
ncbi:MAG: O-antigen ligase family protein [Burkholderiales bacterium]|nr:O-antigen ligase family protein [Burkholderiales bacterium]